MTRKGLTRPALSLALRAHVLYVVQGEPVHDLSPLLRGR